MKNIIRSDSIYVLILNYQSYQDTIDYVECLYSQENVGLNILIVDNCSPNNSFDLLKTTFQGVKNVEVVISERNGGYAYGNNFGLRYLEKKNTDYILISNNDIEVKDPLLLHKMIQEYKTLKDPAFASPLMYVNGRQSLLSAWKMPTLVGDIIGSLRLFELGFDSFKTYSVQSGENRIKVDCLPGSFFMAKKEVFYKIGLMDEMTFLYMEEAILAYKVKKNCLNNYLLTDLRYEHMTSKTISSELSSIKIRKHLIDSRLYFHKEYLKTSIFGRILLIFLFYVWKVETLCYVKVKEIKNKFA
jgi:GT2 family glycosyltransferase